jgi:UDP-N-acetylmuramyl tripeptide synthase
MSIRTLLALWAGKLTITALRLLGRSASSLPGRVARAIDPAILSALARTSPGGVIAISGTNGKTTTAKLLAGMLAAGARPVVHNRAGANLIQGLTTALLADARLTGALRGHTALLEIDEATMPAACRELRPRVGVVTNFFRDQLDRYGELTTTQAYVARGLAHLADGGVAALNADDPLCAALGQQVQPLYYGIEARVADPGMQESLDIKYCLSCGAPYQYTRRFYGHLGHYHCAACGARRPQPHVYADELVEELDGTRLHIVTPKGDFSAKLPIPGLYNVYNALAAVAGALAAGVELDAIAVGLSSATSGFGRMERIPVGDKHILMALVKNPTGFNSVIRTVLGSQGQKRIVIGINDRYADGTDVSWLWDVDFESLAAHQEALGVVVVSGIRAEDMAVRLKYAGIETGRILVERDLATAVRQGLAATASGETLFVLPTYTAMLELREWVQKQGYAKAYWEV